MMNVRSLARIAEALDVEPSELLDGVTSEVFAPEGSVIAKPVHGPEAAAGTPGAVSETKR